MTFERKGLTMKKFLATLLLVAILVSSVAFAADLLKFKKNAYLYEKPRCHKTSTVIKKGSIAKGAASAKMTAGHFSMVKINGKKFYVKSELVEVVKKGSEKIIYAAGGTQKSKEAGSEEKVSGYKKVRATGKCNIRATASLQGKSLGTFKKGKWMTFKGVKKADDRGVYWYKIVTSKGVTGWVSEAYTKLEK